MELNLSCYEIFTYNKEIVHWNYGRTVDMAVSKLSARGIWGLVIFLKTIIRKAGGSYSSNRKASRAYPQNTEHYSYLTLKGIIKDCSSVRKKRKKRAKSIAISDYPETMQLNRFADLWLRFQGYRSRHWQSVVGNIDTEAYFKRKFAHPGCHWALKVTNAGRVYPLTANEKNPPWARGQPVCFLLHVMTMMLEARGDKSKDKSLLGSQHQATLTGPT